MEYWEEIVEEVFIRRAEKEEEAMPDLCQDSDDDEDDILNYYVCGAEKITGRDGTQEVQEGG